MYYWVWVITEYYCFRKSCQKYINNVTSKKEKVNIETIKKDKTVKLPWVPNLGVKLRKEF